MELIKTFNLSQLSTQINLNTSLFIKTSIGALMVIFGVVIKNTLEQMNMKDSQLKYVGMGLFTIGWILVGMFFGEGRKNSIIKFMLPSLAILASVMMMKKSMEEGKEVNMMFPIIFSASWIVLGFNTGEHLEGNMKYFGLGASALVLLSMLMMLPKQRKECIIDGPGMPLFVIAWIILVIMNSSR